MIFILTANVFEYPSDKHFYDWEICINFILINGIVFNLEFSLHMNLF